MFKCLTDTIMLDDFKTELKRLGMKRIRRDDLRRQSVAVVADSLESKSDDGHMEFCDPLSYSPTRFRAMQNAQNSPTGSPTERLRQDSMTDPRSNPREHMGRFGKKISRLPALKDLSLKPAKRKPQVEAKEQAEGHNEHEGEVPSAPERLSQMRQSLGIIDYHPR